jgi:GTP-binding protein LepA
MTENQPLKALIFDSFYDKHRGVIIYIRLFSGEIKKNQTIYFLNAGTKALINEVGVFTPEMREIETLSSGEVGYIVTGLKNLEQARVGDTISTVNKPELAMPGYKEVIPMVFASLYPVSAEDYPLLQDSIAKLKANDASLTYQPEHIPALGFGYRCGFLGLLHMDIVQERLWREFGLNLILTSPSVEYQIKNIKDEIESVKTPSLLPDPNYFTEILEPWVKIEVFSPQEYVGDLIQIINERRGIFKNLSYISGNRSQITGELPLANMIVDFYDDLKSITNGYATLSYEQLGYRSGDLIKLNIFIAGEVVAPLAQIIHRQDSERVGKDICQKLKELIPRQQFEIAIQAAVGGKFVARETIKAFRKDVTGHLYGGDVTRKMKLLNKQKEGKKRMKMIGKVEIPQEAFLSVLKRNISKES